MPLRPRHGYAVDIHRGLPTGDLNRSESSPPDSHSRQAGARRDPAHICQIRAGGMRLRGFPRWFTSVTPSGLARRTRTIWQCWHVPALSGLLSTLPGVPRFRLPPAFHRSATTDQRRCPFITARFNSASWRSKSPHHFWFTSEAENPVPGSRGLPFCFLARLEIEPGGSCERRRGPGHRDPVHETFSNATGLVLVVSI